MAVERNCVVHVHENPLDKYDVWQRRTPPHQTDSLRLQKKWEISKGLEDSVSSDSHTQITEYEPEDKIADRVNRNTLKSNDNHYTGYTVLAAASKGAKNSGRRAVIDESASRLKLTSPSYQTFHRRHTSGKTTYANSRHVQESKQSESEDDHKTRARRESFDYENDPSLFPGIFCCGRSAHSVVDDCSCMCCVKGFFYHCTKDLNDGETGPTVEQPCSCGSLSKGCVKRWTLLTVCSIFLPCLCCYLPAKGCSDVYKSYKEHKRSCQKRRTGRLDR